MADWSSPFSPHRPVKKEPDEAERRLYCDSCGGEGFDSGDDGFYYCRHCGSQSQDVIDTATAVEDIYGDAGGDGSIYNLCRKRANSQLHPPTTSLPSKKDLFRNFTQSQIGAVKKEAAAEMPFWFEDEVSEPQDFAAQPCPDSDALASEIRLRYVQGMQVILQLQCEKLVESFGVSPLICGLAGTIWLRYVAASKVFDEGWANRVIAESETAEAAAHSRDDQQEKPKIKRTKSKYKSEHHNLYGRRASFIWFHSLRKTIPVYSSLAISFLVCYLAREAILPTDIVDWALEGKLPYLDAFVDMDKKCLGKPSKYFPLDSRRLFRPLRVIGPWELEATTGSIAQTIGLRIPSVNFYAIAHRYLKELYLPVEKILPHACRLYEWSIPADLWLSSNVCRPTYVCVMSILIVTIRILYNIHGQGVWETSQSGSTDLTSMPKFRKRDGNAKENNDATSLMPDKNLSRIQTSEYNTEELLSILDTTYDKISTAHDYSRDLQTYLKYCKDVVFAGLATSGKEEKLIERLWDIYDKQENNDPQEMNTNCFDGNVKRPRDGLSSDTPLDPQRSKEESQESNKDGLAGNSTSSVEAPHVSNCSTGSRDAAVEKMKLNMEENGFRYLPPRVQQKSDGYLHYRRHSSEGKYIYVAHADYYILLRACAKLARVDAQTMHLGVLQFERRLDWIEQRIGSSFLAIKMIKGL